MDESAIKEVVKANKGGTVHEIHGPSVLNGCQVWEVWVKTGGQFTTRFVATLGNGESEYFSGFQKLAVAMDKLHGGTGLQSRVEAHRSLFTTYVAAIAFLASTVLLFVLVYRGTQPNALVFSVFASLVASGGTMFFGVWKER